jgi:shikimate kinase
MMNRAHIIYVIGFMGSGKTTVGKKLAALLDWSFIDLDRKIEEHTGKTIPEIFSQNGECYFRDLEGHLLRTLESGKNTVISTGGGTPCYCENMDFMLNTGLTLYLKLTPGQLKSRLSGSQDERPLIKDFDQDKLGSFIKETLKNREKWYKKSEITIEGIDLDINQLASLIRMKINS